MDENREFTPIGEGQQLAKTVVKPPSEQQVEQKSGLAIRLTEVRANTKAHAQKATQLLEAHSPEAETQEAQERITTPEAARSQLEALAKEEGIPSSEFISRSKQALQTSARLRDQTVTDQRTLEEQVFSHKINIRWKIDERIRELDRVKGVKRIPAALEKRRLEGQKAAAQRQIDQLTLQVEAKRQFIDQITEQEKSIRQKQEEIMLAEIGEEIQAIRSEYERLNQEVLQDGVTTAEIREAYIQQVIAPEVDKIIEERKLPASQKDAFYTALQTYIDHREEPEAQRQPYRQELDRLFTYEAWFWGVKNYCEPLLNGGDKAIVQGLVAKMAAEDIVPVRTAVESQLRDYEQRDYEQRDRFTRIFEKAVEPADRWSRNENSFGSQILREVSAHTTWHFPNMRLWQATKSSKAANEIFGEVIQRQDQEYYTTALDKSLSDTDGRYIDLLRYYPTPDAIRNLVVIAAADSKNYRAVHANWSLDSLSKRPDWKQLLDQAETEHPSLKATRSVLESWNYREYGNHPDIQQAAGDLASSLFEGDVVDQRLTELATVALPNHSILDILTKRSVIQAPEAATLKETETLLERLERLSQETWEKHRQNDYSVPYIEGYSFRKGLRKNLFVLLQTKPGELNEQQAEIIKRFGVLSKMVLENQQDYQTLSYLTSGSVLEKLQDPSLKPADITIFLEAYKTIPALADNYELLGEFCKQFTDEQSIQFFRDISAAYADLKNQLFPVVRLVGNSELSRERALELPSKASDILSGELFSLTTEFPKVYLASNQDCEFFRKMMASYQHNSQIIQEATRSLAGNHISRELALAFPQQAIALMDDKMRETRLFVFQHGDSLLKDTSDIRFMNNLVGEFGKKSDQLIRGYQECLVAGAISTADKELVIEFARQFRVISPTTLQGYKEAKEAGHEKVYIAQLQALAERMTGSGAITDEERKRPYYKDLLRHVYSNNSGQWSSFKSNESCPDRSSDLAGFKTQPRYEIDLLSQSEIRVKAGETLDAAVKEGVQKPILEVAGRMEALGHDREKIQAALQDSVDKTLQEILQKGGLQGVNLESVATLDEKLFLILADSIYGSRSVGSGAIKNLIVTYEFATFEDINDYIAGTRDRVGRANNQDYALFCEVGTFYSDRIKEVNRRLVQAAWNNPTIAAVMPDYFKRLAQDTTMAQRKDLINRLQVDRLGASESFVKQAGRMLEKRRGRKYTPDEVKALMHRYESWTVGLPGKASPSPKPETRAFYGQLRSQRERTFEALKVITGQEVDLKEAHLGEINLQQVLATEASIREGKYDEEQFASYTVQRFIDLFEDERGKIDRELSKFESLSGKQREILYGYVAKSKESAHARMVGGVCVAGDNPDKYPKEKMWSMPNYLQMVFQEPDTLQCQGLVLLHHFNEGGKRVLTASFNPSSTYLYSVDEPALFNGITSALEQFATENGFDLIAVPHNKTIRTNRIGGEFEKAMDKKVAQVGKTFKFDTTQQFSYHPNYQIQEMDVIWEAKK